MLAHGLASPYQASVPHMKHWLALVLLASVARAGEVCHTTSYPAAQTNWFQTLAVPKHDPALGSLQSVRVTVKCVITGSVGVENVLGSGPEIIDSYFSAVAMVQRPHGAGILSVRPTLRSHMTLGVPDGTLDFAGTSGQWLAGLQVEQELHAELTGAADLNLFTDMGSGLPILLRLFASGASFTTGNNGPLAYLSNMQAAVDVSVCYGYREIQQTTSLPTQAVNWNATRSFAKHDPALGPLRAVRIHARTTLTGGVRVESPAPAALLVNSELACVTRIQRPDASTALTMRTYYPTVDPLGAFDGLIDFGGTSGVTHTGISVASSARSTLTSPADLALFTANFPAETISLGVISWGDSISAGGGTLVTQFAASAGCDLDVDYDYSAPVTLYCFGDGSGSRCPCANSIPGAQQGCAHSLGLGGELRAAGFAEIGADSLVLTASNLPAMTTVILLQGTLHATSRFGDGLLCVGGTIVRIGSRSASAGSASFPSSLDAISTLGGAVTGETLRYQAWYRNAAAYCSPAAFNLTNGLTIAW